jgi:hypothetical protein
LGDWMGVLTVPSDESDCVTKPWGQPFPDEDASTMVISSGGDEVADWRGATWLAITARTGRKAAAMYNIMRYVSRA